MPDRERLEEARADLAREKLRELTHVMYDRGAFELSPDEFGEFVWQAVQSEDHLMELALAARRATPEEVGAVADRRAGGEEDPALEDESLLLLAEALGPQVAGREMIVPKDPNRVGAREIMVREALVRGFDPA